MGEACCQGRTGTPELGDGWQYPGRRPLLQMVVPSEGGGGEQRTQWVSVVVGALFL